MPLAGRLLLRELWCLACASNGILRDVRATGKGGLADVLSWEAGDVRRGLAAVIDERWFVPASAGARHEIVTAPSGHRRVSVISGDWECRNFATRNPASISSTQR